MHHTPMSLKQVLKTWNPVGERVAFIKIAVFKGMLTCLAVFRVMYQNVL